MDFEWSVKSDNETSGLQEVRSSDTGAYPASFLILNNDFAVQRTYRCVANNSIGVGTFCEIEVAGKISIISSYFVINKSKSKFMVNNFQCKTKSMAQT